MKILLGIIIYLAFGAYVAAWEYEKLNEGERVRLMLVWPIVFVCVGLSYLIDWMKALIDRFFA